MSPELDEATARTASEAARKQRFPNQWHLDAHTGKPVREIKFLAVAVPYRASEGEPAIALEKVGDMVVCKVGDTTVAAWMGTGTQGKLTVSGLAAKGRLVVRVTEDGRMDSAVAQ